MSIEKTPLTQTLINQLYELVCTPFLLLSFREQWKSFGWFYDPSDEDEFGFRVQIPQSWALLVDPLGEGIASASFPFYYWDDFAPEDHKDLDAFRRERAAYDDEFDAAAHLAQRVLSAPVRSWKDDDKDGHRAVVWQGELRPDDSATGLFRPAIRNRN